MDFFQLHFNFRRPSQSILNQSLDMGFRYKIENNKVSILIPPVILEVKEFCELISLDPLPDEIKPPQELYFILNGEDAIRRKSYKFVLLFLESYIIIRDIMEDYIAPGVYILPIQEISYLIFKIDNGRLKKIQK